MQNKKGFKVDIFMFLHNSIGFSIILIDKLDSLNILEEHASISFQYISLWFFY